MSEIQQTPVVRPIADHDALTSRVVPSKLQRHEICLGARIGEPHLLNRWKAIDDCLRYSNLVGVHSPETPAVFKGCGHRRPNRCRVVT